MFLCVRNQQCNHNPSYTISHWMSRLFLVFLVCTIHFNIFLINQFFVVVIVMSVFLFVEKKVKYFFWNYNPEMKWIWKLKKKKIKVSLGAISMECVRNLLLIIVVLRLFKEKQTEQTKNHLKCHLVSSFIGWIFFFLKQKNECHHHHHIWQ